VGLLGRGKVTRREMAQRSTRRDQENQLCDTSLEHVVLIWT
jgi:hypothetical protein